MVEVRRSGGASVADVPLQVTGTFIAVAIVLGVLAGREVALAPLIHLPIIDSVDEAVRTFQPGGPMVTISRPSTGWVIAAGLGMAMVYVLSVLAHELGHLIAARRVGVDIAAVQLDAAGGYVEIDDDDRLTAGGLAVIAGAGPIVTGVLALLLGILLTTLGWPLTGVPDSELGAVIALGRVLSAGFMINVVVLLVNLLPVRVLDGGHLLAAARLWHTRRGH